MGKRVCTGCRTGCSPPSRAAGHLPSPRLQLAPFRGKGMEQLWVHLHTAPSHLLPAPASLQGPASPSLPVFGRAQEQKRGPPAPADAESVCCPGNSYFDDVATSPGGT